ncbi:hypothetical protein C8Q80DRAFT_1179090 [Daedaleopsis nitida]|nr:hypothetical protein C8Q80DRAFT_1179090 [Daedaleopsis nitida]
MDTIHLYFDARAEWVLIRHPGAPGLVSKDILWGGLFTGFVSLPTQVYFVLRIRRLVNLNQTRAWRWFTFIVVSTFILCSIFQFVGYVVFLYLCLQGPKSFEGVVLIEKLPIAFWAAGAAEDVLISLILLWLLWRDRIINTLAGLRGEETDPMTAPSQRTTRLLQRVSIVVLNTGIWTAGVALAIIIALRIAPALQLYPGLFFNLGPLYCNTLLANLNGRGFIRGDEYEIDDPTRFRSVFLRNRLKTASSPGNKTRSQITTAVPEPIQLKDLSTARASTEIDKVPR